METNFYVLNLIAPRTTFFQDMTPEEMAIMQNHLGYWNDMMSKGIAKVFGPVFDPKGVYGLGIVEVESEHQLNEIIKNDPANGLHRYEAYPMKAIFPVKK